MAVQWDNKIVVKKVPRESFELEPPGEGMGRSGQEGGKSGSHLRLKLGLCLKDKTN